MAADTPSDRQILWSLPEGTATRMGDYLHWVGTRRGATFADYSALHRWSVDTPGEFWTSLLDYFDVQTDGDRSPALVEGEGPARISNARWFPNLRLNHAEHLLRKRGPELAVLALNDIGGERRLSRDELLEGAARVATGLRALGVGEGDRVCGLLPNVPEALMAFLGAASIGATWSSCSPDFGAASVLSRFAQVEPSVLFVATSYTFKGTVVDRCEVVRDIQAGLPSLRATVAVPGGSTTTDLTPWEDFLGPAETLTFARVPFEHPLWILYSSGTTGPPKPIVHGHGGILLEHFKALALHGDLGEDDLFFWYSSTGWMMWNYLLGALLLGTPIVLYDGHPMHPDALSLWRMAADHRVTFFGTSAPYLHACLRMGLRPRDALDLSAIRGVGSTGAPLSPAGFRWVTEAVGPVHLQSVSGGTDVCTAFALGNPLQPVRAGELQCSGLGCKLEAYDPHDRAGRPLPAGQTGELVLTQPLPSMPVCLWNDSARTRLRASYFDHFANGAWRHGDWVRFEPDGGMVISGRSDATLNRGGIRKGTSEFYASLRRTNDAGESDLPELVDSLVIHLEPTGATTRDRLLLFVVLAEGVTMGEGLATRIRSRLATDLGPTFRPNTIVPVPEIPTTLSGKKLEVPVKRILRGTPVAEAANPAALRSPGALDAFVEYAHTLS